MPTERMRQAANALDKIDEETGLEMQELRGAIEEVEQIHEDHMEELEADKHFINDLKTLFKEIRAIRQITHHMEQEVQHYGNGDMSKQEFKQAFIRDEEKLEEIVGEVRTELEEIVRILSEEERLTNKDLDVEDATENLVRALNDEEAKLEEAHGRVRDIVSGA